LEGLLISGHLKVMTGEYLINQAHILWNKCSKTKKKWTGKQKRKKTINTKHLPKKKYGNTYE
jgi:hypothetical protein